MTLPDWWPSDKPWIIGDCMKIMPKLPSGKIDMILCDMPYSTTACSWDTLIPFEPLWEQYKRIIKDNRAIILTASQPFTSALIMSNPNWFKYEWIWIKNRATGHVHAKNKPMKRHENICVFSGGNTLHKNQSKKRMPYHPQGLVELPKGTRRRTRNDMGDDAVMGKRKSHKETITTHTGYPTTLIECSIEMNDRRFHEAQKPVALFEYLIKTYTNEGDIVFDNCLGSGTTLEACMNTGRIGMGCEIDEQWERVIAGRLKQDIKKLDYFMEADQ